MKPNLPASGGITAMGSPAAATRRSERHRIGGPREGPDGALAMVVAEFQPGLAWLACQSCLACLSTWLAMPRTVERGAWSVDDDDGDAARRK